MKYALKGADLLFETFVSLNVTLEVLCIGDLIVMISSTSGGVASKHTLNFQRPPDFLKNVKSKFNLKGFIGSNTTLYSIGSPDYYIAFLRGWILSQRFISCSRFFGNLLNSNSNLSCESMSINPGNTILNFFYKDSLVFTLKV